MTSLRLLPILASVAFVSAVHAADGLRPCPEPAAADYHFPKGLLGQVVGNDLPATQASAESLRTLRIEHDEFKRQWYGGHLRGMDEPSLSCGQPGTQYRFTWLRSFHPPVAIRVLRNGHGWQLVATEFEGAGGYGPGDKPLRRIDRAIDEREFEALRRAARAAVDDSPPPPDILGMDGAQWIVEAVDADGYRMIERWSPDEGLVRETGFAFLKLAGWDGGAEIY